MALLPNGLQSLNWRSLLSGLFFLVALCVGGGAVGLTVGVPLDTALRSDARGFPGLLGILLGVPVGALVGVLLGVARVRDLSLARRVRLGSLSLAVAAACALVLFLAVQTGLMSW